MRIPGSIHGVSISSMPLSSNLVRNPARGTRMKNIKEIQAELRERQIPVWLSSDHRRIRLHTPSCPGTAPTVPSGPTSGRDWTNVPTSRLHPDGNSAEWPNLARKSKANLMLRMCLLSSLRKENKQFEGQKPVDGFSVRRHKSAIASYGISYESNRPCTTGPELVPSISETVPGTSVNTPNEINHPKVWNLGAKQCM